MKFTEMSINIHDFRRLLEKVEDQSMTLNELSNKLFAVENEYEPCTIEFMKTVGQDQNDIRKTIEAIDNLIRMYGLRWKFSKVMNRVNDFEVYTLKEDGTENYFGLMSSKNLLDLMETEANKVVFGERK